MYTYDLIDLRWAYNDKYYVKQRFYFFFIFRWAFYNVVFICLLFIVAERSANEVSREQPLADLHGDTTTVHCQIGHKGRRLHTFTFQKKKKKPILTCERTTFLISGFTPHRAATAVVVYFARPFATRTFMYKKNK